MYKKIAATLAAQLAGDDSESEVRFVDKLAHAVTYFATLGDPSVELVDFDKGGFKILRFKNLEHKLKTVNLTASYIATKATPEIVIHERGNPKNALISIRSKRETKKSGEIYVRNLIEKGRLLEELTRVEQRNFADMELPDPETTRVQIKHPGRRAVSRDKDSSPRERR